MSYNSSYFFGDDTISGWGPRYFFSFYSEYGEGRSGMIIEVSFFVVIFVLSFIANLMIAAAVLKYPEMRTVTNCFLLNLTAADIAFVAGIPALVYTRLNHEWELGNFACKLLPYSQVSLSFSLDYSKKLDTFFKQVPNKKERPLIIFLGNWFDFEN